MTHLVITAAGIVLLLGLLAHAALTGEATYTVPMFGIAIAVGVLIGQYIAKRRKIAHHPPHGAE